MSAEREIVLTVNDRQHADLAKAVARLRRSTGAASNTAAILEAVHAQAESTIEPSSKRKAAA